MATAGSPIGLLSALTYPSTSGGNTGQPIGLLLALTYTSGSPPPTTTRGSGLAIGLGIGVGFNWLGALALLFIGVLTYGWR